MDFSFKFLNFEKIKTNLSFKFLILVLIFRKLLWSEVNDTNHLKAPCL